MPEVATPNQGEREFETGTDESFKNANATGGAAHNENQRVTYANIKRTRCGAKNYVTPVSARMHLKTAGAARTVRRTDSTLRKALKRGWPSGVRWT